jgi:MoaA/NifB/PqqE/SkfB family radical SAM enzyme
VIWKDRLKVVWRTMGYREAWRIRPRQSLALLKYMFQTRPTWRGDSAELNAYSPPVGGAGYRRYLDGLLRIGRGEWTPLVVHLSVTDRCPYGCRRCSNLSRAADDPPLEDLLRVVGELRTAGTTRVALTGGEPLLRDDLPAIVEACAPDQSPLLFTSGFNLDAHLAHALHDAGLSAAFVSLDHFSADQHDRIRGRAGAFAMAVEAIRACLQADIYTAVQAVVEPSLLQPGVLEQFLDYCNALGVHEIMLLEAVAIGADRVAETLDETGRDRLVNLHRRAASDAAMPKISSMARLESPDCLGCQAGFTFLHISAQGEAFPCDFVPASFGNVYESGVEEVRHRMTQLLKQPSRACLALQLPKLYGERPSQPFTWNQTQTILKNYEPGPLPGMLEYLDHA